MEKYSNRALIVMGRALKHYQNTVTLPEDHIDNLIIRDLIEDIEQDLRKKERVIEALKVEAYYQGCAEQGLF